MIKWLLHIFLLCFSSIIVAQEVNFTASSRDVVAKGDRFQITYTLNADGKNFRGPEITDFRVLGGPNPSTNRSFSIINGKMSQSVTNSYTYYLQAIITGTFTIPPATIEVDGKEYTSNELTIEVVEGAQQQQQPQQRTTPAQGQPSRKSQAAPTPSGSLEEDVFIKAFVSKTDPYQGEQIIVTYKMYTAVPISNIRINRLSSFNGFWSKNLMQDDGKLRQYTETYNGKEYVVADLRKIALFPQKSGKLTIEPMELECIAQVRKQGTRRVRDPFFDSFFDDPFFNNFYRNVEISLASNPISINVRQLPDEGRPNNFSGAVGSFTINSSIDKQELKANEAINLRYTISGRGNLELIDRLNLTFPPDFEAYDPKIVNNIRTSLSGISGSRSFEYLLIPRNAGTFTIKPVNFSYFDLNSETYKILRTPGYTVTVEKGDEASAGVAYSGVSQADIQYIGSDIRHIKTMAFQVNRINDLLFGKRIYFLLFLIPVVIFLIIVLIWRRRIKRMQDQSFIKNRRATKVARKKLRTANNYLRNGNKDDFYTEISRALWGYLSDKFNIPLSELSLETVNDRLESKKIKEETINEFTETLNNCEYARFAPGDASDTMQKNYSEAIHIISKIERELKS